MDLGGTIEITAAYSNALLVAILPHVSDFAGKLELDLPLPVTTNHVQTMSISRTEIGGSVLLTNGMQFSFRGGYVGRYVTPVYERVDRDHTWPADERVNLTRPQAVQVVRKAITALGYDGDVLCTDLEPVMVEEPVKIRGRMYARYHMEWMRPWVPERGPSVEAVVNADSGELEMVAFFHNALRRPPPTLAVPPTVKPYPASQQRVYLTEVEEREFLERLLPQVDSMVQKLDLPIPRPVTRSQVKEFEAWWFGDQLDAASILLTNGYGIGTWNGRTVKGFWAPDAFFGVKVIRVSEFFGPWNLSQSQAIKLARETVAKLGHPKEVLDCSSKPKVDVPFLVGAKRIPRYRFFWSRKDRSSVTVEVDAERGRVTELSFWSSALEPDVPTRKKQVRP